MNSLVFNTRLSCCIGVRRELAPHLTCPHAQSGSNMKQSVLVRGIVTIPGNEFEVEGVRRPGSLNCYQLIVI